jgi:hypothetical protein
MIGVLPVERLFVRSAQGMDELARLTRGADHEIVGEVFKFTNDDAISALAGRADDVRATFLADPENLPMRWFRTTRELLESTGATFTPFGEYPRKVHAKGFTFDAERGWLSTTPVMPLRGDILDFTATFSGDAALALRKLTLTTIDKGVKAQRRAAAEAATHGILLNDRHAGITQLRDGVKHVIDNANEELVLVTKAITDEKLARRIVARAQEGVDVYIATHTSNMSKRVRKIFEKGGVSWVDDPAGLIHGNAAVADGQLGYFGSGHFTGRAMVRNAGVRSSRELGALVGGEHARAIRDEILDFTRDMTAPST